MPRTRADQPNPPGIEIAASTATDAAEASLLAIGYTGANGSYTLLREAADGLQAAGADALAILDGFDANGAAGDIHVLPLRSTALGQVVLVGLGDETARDYRRAGAALIRTVQGATVVTTSIGATATDEELGAFCEGLVLGGFRFQRSSAAEAQGVLRVVLTGVPSSAADVVRRATVRATASWRSRGFALTPSNEKNPQQLETWARAAAARGGLRVEVWDEDRMAESGMGGVLAVGAGSPSPSRFIRLDYRPAGADAQTPMIALVGKGITFDTGGISIKPSRAMMNMKRDMTGAGVVIAVMGALRDLAVPVSVTGLIAAAENAFGGASMRPSDVVTHYGGRTSEIGNTDAEGRLVLADALAYADARLDPDVVVDIATLTGAGRVAVGTSLGVLFANDDTLAAQIQAAGRRVGEPVWRLPLSQEYEPLLESPVADATNAAGGPGAITAALFLQHFAGDRRWAHLDIASIGDSAKDEFEYTSGATGFGARLLLTWLCQFEPTW
jgi:leucyl aminopeptidase